MFKMFNNETEWDIFQNIIQSNARNAVIDKKEQLLLRELKEARWSDNTNSRPDFISDNFMIEMFEIDDIVTKKRGKNNPQRKADARALREVEKFMSEFPKGTFHENALIIARGDTRYNPETNDFTPDDSISHHNYQAYLSNFTRICQKHLNNVDAYKDNYPNKRLGFLIVDDSTYYVNRKKTNKISQSDAVCSLPTFDKNFMEIFINSRVDFILWAFNNKYFYTMGQSHGGESPLPNIFLLTKANYDNRYSKYFDIDSMISLEE